jgi:hypothetical protein
VNTHKIERGRGILDAMKAECNVEWVKKSIAQIERGEGVVYNDVDQIIASRE